MRRKRNRRMAGIAAGILCLSMIGGYSRVPESRPEIDTSPPFYEPSGEEQTEPEGSMITSEPQAESTEGMEITLESGGQSGAEETDASETPEHTETPGETALPESSSGELTNPDTGAHLTESAEVERTEAPEPEENTTEAVKVPEMQESEADQPPTELESPALPESTESKTETTTEAVTEEKTTERLETEETEPAEVTTEAPTEPETEAVTQPTLQPETNPVTQPTLEPETVPSTQPETEAEPEESTERETEVEVVLQSIQIKANQSQYAEGWKLTKANLTVRLYYSDGSSGTLTNGYSIHQTGDQVYVTYSGVKSNTITVIYEKTLTSISIESKADRYEQGYQIISANLQVTLHYSDGSTETITHGYTIYQSGEKVYITYDGVTSNTITINYAAASRVEIRPKAERYGLGDVITIDDFVITAYQSDGSSQVVTDNLKLYYMGNEVTCVTLTEYDGEVYVMGAHSFRVSYKDVLSDTVLLNVKYEETGHLYREMLTLVNEARAQAGLPALVWDTEAEGEILIRAEELTRLYAHDRPGGTPTTELYPMFWGENIANGGYYSRTHVHDVFTAWMNSAGHRSLIMDSFEYATGFVCASHISTDANGNQAAYTVMWVTMD